MYYFKIKKDFFKTMDNPKELLVLYYLFIQENKEGCIIFSIKDLIEYWGYKPKRNEDKINQIFKTILAKFKENNIIVTNTNFENIPISQKIYAMFSFDNNTVWYLKEKSSFVTLSIKELNTLRQYIHNQNEKIQIEKILFLYLIIKSHMNFSPQNISYCFPTIETLKNICELSKTTVNKYINILTDCNMIYTYSIGNFINIYGQIIPIPKLYTLNNIDLKTLKNNLSVQLHNFKEWEVMI